MTGSLLDVCLALLLISAAAVTLSDAAGHEATSPTDRAGEATALLATTTAAVPYTLETNSDQNRQTASRVAHRTLAGHLAAAAVRSATLDGTTLSPSLADYRRAVRVVVADTLGPTTNVSVVWKPLPGTGIVGSLDVGPQPPATADIDAARFTVPVGGVDAANTTPEAATVAVLFPPDRIAASARDDGVAPTLVRARYRRAGAALGVDAVGAFDADDPRAANSLLAASLVDRRGEASTVDTTTNTESRVGRVVVVVRTWEP